MLKEIMELLYIILMLFVLFILIVLFWKVILIGAIVCSILIAMAFVMEYFEEEDGENKYFEDDENDDIE